ncbi:ABC transporter permease [Halobacillus fulvus]|nr:ABC transporter permease [Halobacillus fulvus]
MHTLRLLQNEWIKLVKKPSTIVMGSILVVLVATLTVFVATFDDLAFWEFVNQASSLYAIVILFSIIAGGSTVASEFSNGTIKLLLIRPVKRVKILAVKFFVVVLFGSLLLLILAGATMLAGGLAFGFEPLFINGENQLADLGETYVLYAVELVVYAAMAFTISTVFRSNSLAIGLSIFLMFVGPQLSLFASRYEWAKYLLFANANLTQFKEGRVMLDGLTIEFSLAVLAAYLILFAIVSWQVFQRRDVAV